LKEGVKLGNEVITIAINSAELEQKLSVISHIKNAAPRAIMRAMNKTVAGIKTDSSREVSKVFAVQKSSVKKKMFVKRDDNSITVIRKGPRFFARSFPYDRNTNPGVRGGKAAFLRPYRDGSGWSLDSERGLSKAFVARLPKRGFGVYRRIGKYRNRLTHARGLSVPEMLNEPNIKQVINQNAMKRFHKELDHQIAHLSGGGK